MKGIIAATYAPMNQDGLLNTDIIEDYGNFLVANKVSGAFINGSTGDFTALSSMERKELIAAWSEQRSEGLFLINHVGHNNLNEAVELAGHSADMVDATAALPPFYFRPKTLDDLVFYCKQIAQAAPNIPFYYYHIPILTRVSLPMLGFIEKAHDEIPNFAGIKYTEDNLSDFKQCVDKVDGSLDMFFGIDEKYMDSIQMDAQGWVGSTYNHLAPLYHEVASLANQDLWEAAGKLQAKAIHFVQVLEALGGYHGGGKSFMRYFGLDMGPSRFPHKTFNDSLLRQAIRSFEKEGLSDYLAKPFYGDSVA